MNFLRNRGLMESINKSKPKAKVQLPAGQVKFEPFVPYLYQAYV